MVNQLNSTILNRFSTTIATSLFIFLFIFTFHGFPYKPNKSKSLPSNSSKLFYQQTFLSLSLSSNDTVSHYHRELTLHPHLAGTPAADRVTDFIRSHFKNLGLETKTAEYEVLLSYPTRASLTADFTGGGRTEFEFNLIDGGDTRVVPPYHAYSPSGTAVGPAVYVNYGTEKDYRELKAAGVNVTGCVVVVRRGGAASRGDVVRKAAEKGAVAVLTFTAEPGVERGTVMKGVGDPLSPGWGSVLGTEQLSRAHTAVASRFPKIPSLPVSLETALGILRSLEGSQVPFLWKDHTLKLGVHTVGPGPTLLNFSYQGEEKVSRISDVFGVIRGEEEADRYILLGNHRDAWTYGAVDPNSGTAALLDVARRFSYLMGLGWRPRRTIILCSWDAEEFGMIGSTEWVEENIMNLGSKAVAYLNVDCAVQGPGIFPSTTPQLDDLLIDITKLVMDPDARGMTVYEEWTTRNKGVNIQRLNGVDSDFAPFLQHAGVPSLDIYFGKDFPVYHTAFDSYEWMITHGDPLFHRHVAVAGLWGMLALRLADDPILPFNYSSYAVQLQEYTDTLSRILEDRASVVPITDSIQHLLLAAKIVQHEAEELRLNASVSIPVMMLKERMLNDRLMLAERGLLDADGLLGNKWFKHLVYGPSDNHETELSQFPSIGNTISEDDVAIIQHEIWRVARAVRRVADVLRGDLP